MIRALGAVQLGRGNGAMPVAKPLRSVLSPQIVDLEEARDTILLIDSTTISRESLAYWLQAHIGNIAVEACADASQATGSPPKMVLIHLHSLRVDDPFVRSQIAKLHEVFGHSQRIAVIADLEQGELAIAAIQRSSLQGYIPTNLGSGIVAAAIRLLLEGGIFAPPELIAKQAHSPPTLVACGEPPTLDARQLTSREADVLRLLRRGRPNKLIAFELAISESTVKVHIRNIMRKTNVTNRTQVALLSDNPADTKDAGPSNQASLKAALRQVEKTPVVVPLTKG